MVEERRIGTYGARLCPYGQEIFASAGVGGAMSGAWRGGVGVALLGGEQGRKKPSSVLARCGRGILPGVSRASRRGLLPRAFWQEDARPRGEGLG